MASETSDRPRLTAKGARTRARIVEEAAVLAVIDYQADTIVKNHRHALRSADGVEAWRNMVITGARRTQAKGGCPLGSFGGQLAESDPEARALIAAGFDQWAAAIGDGLRSLHADGKLPSDIDPDDLATTLLATLPAPRSSCRP